MTNARPVFILCLLLVGANSCQDDRWLDEILGMAGGKGGAEPTEKRFARFVRQLDKNRDGKVQISELSQKRQQKLTGMDADNDNVVSLAEFDAFRASRKQQVLEQTDANRDGVIEAGETSPATWARVSKTDADRDGKVTEEELLEGPDKSGRRHKGRRHGGKKPKGGGKGQGKK
jgi:Ca2+-binding EF-hand superfamily protein